jgi:hypothetical protein
MTSKEEIRTKWIRHTPLLKLDDCVDNAMEEYATLCQKDFNKDLYSKIENLIVIWSNDGTKTAGTLTRQIIKLLNKKEVV